MAKICLSSHLTYGRKTRFLFFALFWLMGLEG